MKTLMILVLVLAGLPAKMDADLVTFRFSGTAQSSYDLFVAGRPYVYTVVVNASTAPSPIYPDETLYPNAIVSSVFNYDSGTYVAQGSNVAIVVANNYDSNFLDRWTVQAIPGLTPVGGRPIWGGWFTLDDYTKTAFTNTDLPRTLQVDQFLERSFVLQWGAYSSDVHAVQFSIDSVADGGQPSIFGLSQTNGAITLAMQFSTQQQTNYLERSYTTGPSAQWDLVGTFVGSGGITNYTVPLSPGQPAAFYRIRAQ